MNAPAAAAYARLRAQLLAETATLGERTRSAILKALDDVRHDVDDDPAWLERILQHAAPSHETFIDK